MSSPKIVSASAPDRRALKLFVVLSRAAAAVESHAERDVARHGLSITEFGVIEALYHKGPLLLGEVQRKILLSSGGITYTVDRLVEKGLVERRDCPGDRRARFAALTSEGESLMDEIFPAHVAALRTALSSLTAREQDETITLLRKLGRGAAQLIQSADGGSDEPE